MNRIGTSAPVDPGSSLGWRFPLRRISFREFGPLLRASIAPFRAAPLRLTGMFLLLWVPVEALMGVEGLGLFLKEAAAAVVFTGYTGALDAASRSDPPDFRHVGVVLRFGRDKTVLLVLSGLLPIAFGALVLCAVWGLGDTSTFLNDLSRSTGHPSPVMALDLRAADYVASMPFTFVSPVWALYRWSGSRSMAANLLACLVNWRWVLATTGFLAMTDTMLDWLSGQSDELALASLVGVIVLQMLSLSWTLALAQRSFPAR
jgi:hypothetical protein